MHELALMESLVSTVREQVDCERVTRVLLRVGRLSCVTQDALRFCFEVCARDTVLEGAVLELIDVPGRGRCRECREEFGLDATFEPCRCGSFDIELLAGEELRLDGVEVI